MIPLSASLVVICLLLSTPVRAESTASFTNPPVRLSLPPAPSNAEVKSVPFDVPLPAHAQSAPAKPQATFSVESSRKGTPPKAPKEVGSAQYFLTENKKKESITPEIANLNMPVDTVLIATDTGEKIFLPAGTYRQIMQFPIDSPVMAENTRTRDLKSPTIETGEPKSRYAEPSVKPIWVRYESLEKIKIGEVERRGGLDVPSHGPKNLGPRVWYAKSETADLASSAFYFVFGGLGYGIANLAGWSAGNTREIPNDFEYRLIRK